MNKKNSPDQNSCYCSHCRNYSRRVFGGADAVGQLTKEADSFLMRSVVRDVSLQKHPARLSVRWVGSGRYTYEIESRNYLLQPGNFLIVADGETYNSASDSQALTECFNVSFHPKILSDVINAQSESEEWLLDNPFDLKDKNGISFFTDLYEPNAEMKTLLDWFHLRAAGGSHTHQIALDESFYDLMERIVFLQKQTSIAIGSIPSRKRSTREELYRRLRRAQSFIRANAVEDLNIEKIAGVACLSAFHFLRSYKAAFGISPHQELLDVRLEKARRLMSVEKNKFTLGRIAFESGFSDLSSFSKAFRQKFKTPPSKFDPSGNFSR